MSSGSFTSAGIDSKRQRVLPVPKATANMKTFTPDSSIASDVIPSPNHGDRNKGRQPDMIVLHYTGMPDVEGAIARLCTAGTEVSAHYIVLEDGRIVQCVPEAKRAWHAGVSSWAGEDDINSCSIGIEIINRGHDWGYPEYPLRQIAAVIALCRGIMLRRNVPRTACSAIPTSRRRARRIPARNFRGIRWPIPASGTGCSPRRSCAAKPEARHHQRRGAGMQQALARYGYGVPTGKYRRRDDGSRHRLPAPFPPRAGRRRRRSLDDVDIAGVAGEPAGGCDGGARRSNRVRHCERSEAIHVPPRQELDARRYARNDGM